MLGQLNKITILKDKGVVTTTNGIYVNGYTYEGYMPNLADSIVHFTKDNIVLSIENTTNGIIQIGRIELNILE